MATHLVSPAHGLSWQVTHSSAYQWLVPIGRLLYGAVFLISSMMHFTPAMVEYAAGEGVPMPTVLVPLSGVMALVGALSVILGYKARYGAALLVLFLIPVTFMMHRFWLVPDAGMALVQRVMFLKNLSMLGGALLIFCHGAGPVSFDARAERGESPGSA